MTLYNTQYKYNTEHTHIEYYKNDTQSSFQKPFFFFFTFEPIFWFWFVTIKYHYRSPMKRYLTTSNTETLY